MILYGQFTITEVRVSEGKWGGGLSITYYPLILVFTIIRGLSPLDFLKSDHQDLEGR